MGLEKVRTLHMRDSGGSHIWIHLLPNGAVNCSTPSQEGNTAQVCFIIYGEILRGDPSSCCRSAFLRDECGSAVSQVGAVAMGSQQESHLEVLPFPQLGAGSQKVGSKRKHKRVRGWSQEASFMSYPVSQSSPSLAQRDGISK